MSSRTAFTSFFPAADFIRLAISWLPRSHSLEESAGYIGPKTGMTATASLPAPRGPSLESAGSSRFDLRESSSLDMTKKAASRETA